MRQSRVIPLCLRLVDVLALKVYKGHRQFRGFRRAMMSGCFICEVTSHFALTTPLPKERTQVVGGVCALAPVSPIDRVTPCNAPPGERYGPGANVKIWARRKVGPEVAFQP